MLVLAAFAVCFAGGIVPVISADVFVFASAALAPPGQLMLLVLAASAGQVAGKAVLFSAVRGSVKSSWLKRWCTRGAAATAPALPLRAVDALVFSSASVGLPPFFVATAAVGAGSMPLARFCAAAFAGRVIRLAVIATSPHLLLRVFS